MSRTWKIAVAPMQTCVRYLALIAVVTLALACGGVIAEPGEASPMVVVSPNPAAMTVGETINMVAVPTGNAAGQAVTWKTHHPAVATVDAASGVVTGVAAGYAAITATASGGASGSSAVTVRERD
jgi:hypothetical protein